MDTDMPTESHITMEVHTASSYSLTNVHTNPELTAFGEVFRPGKYRHWTIELPDEPVMSFPGRLTLSSILLDEAAVKVVEDRPSKSTAHMLIITCAEQLPISEEARAIPFSRDLFQKLVDRFWAHRLWNSLWRSTGGSIFVARTDKNMPNGILLQTPRDTRPFISLCIFDVNQAPASETLASGIFISPSEDIFQSLLAGQDYPDFSTTRGYVQRDLFILPILILETSSRTTSEFINSIDRSLQKIEKRISSAEGLIGLSLIQELQNLATQYMELDSRCNFEYDLSGELMKCFSCIEDQRTNMRTRHHYESTSVRRVESAQKTAAYSAEKLKRVLNKIERLKTDFRDTNAYILADATQKDGASMKTIAFLTLLFLPATAIASIFSMSMFNWQASPNEQTVSPQLWIYFAVAFPLTAVLISCWLLWFYWRTRFSMAAKDFLNAVKGVNSHDNDRASRHKTMSDSERSSYNDTNVNRNGNRDLEANYPMRTMVS